jgi:SAM-dependent methyltransferase
MENTNNRQVEYWNREGATKTFTHPVNLDWLRKHLEPKARILDYGCGYGRVAALLSERGYQAIGVDAAVAMIEKVQNLYPHLSFQPITPPCVPFADGFFDAAVLFAVLTCIPNDDDQRAVIKELHRVVRPGGLLYVSDYWLQADDRNRQRYARDLEKYRTYGVFEVSKGIAVRHHSREWIEALFRRWLAEFETCVDTLAEGRSDPLSLVRAYVAAIGQTYRASNERSSVMLALLIQSENRLEQCRQWYHEQFTRMKLTSGKQQRLRLAFFAAEGVFMLRCFGFAKIGDEDWQAIFHGIESILLE